MAIGLFGGTFDPIHHGHLITALFVKEICNLDKIIFIPCKISPLKVNISQPTNDIHRMNMINLAIKDTPYFESSNYEINKNEISYTIDTVTYFRQFYEDIKLIIGYDNYQNLSQWKHTDQIQKLCNIVVLKRESSANTDHNILLDNIQILDTPQVDIQATKIRKRISDNKPINYLVPEKVIDYINCNVLYKNYI